MPVVVTDPNPARRMPRVANTTGERIALRLIHDIRDLPFLKLMVLTTVTVVASGILLFVPGVFRWWLGAAHIALVVYFLGPFILMLHNTSHRRLFRGPFLKLNLVIPWIIGPFFGESPETYFSHHIGMHHPENNCDDDLSSTLGYKRDSIPAFARYFLHFFFIVIFEIAAYFAKRKRHRLMVRTILGEATFFAAVILLLRFEWRATLVVFVAPFIIARFGMMDGNWAQHAFVDSSAPDNCYRNSITCINSGYNARCFNDGYHIGHHLKSGRHWTEMPQDFIDNVDSYAKERAVVFEGVDYFAIWALLMVKRYDLLAKRIVQLDETPRSAEEIITMLKSRTGWTGTAAESRALAALDGTTAS